MPERRSSGPRTPRCGSCGCSHWYLIDQREQLGRLRLTLSCRHCGAVIQTAGRPEHYERRRIYQFGTRANCVRCGGPTTVTSTPPDVPYRWRRCTSCGHSFKEAALGRYLPVAPEAPEADVVPKGRTGRRGKVTG